MKIILATGIYPPAIGGPATYVRALAEELKKSGVDVTVVTYARKIQAPNSKLQDEVIRVPMGLPLIRWFSYARALKKYGRDADAVIAFSSVSCGVPLAMAKLKKPKKILRLGGDFFWERYTDRGGMKSLREWYGSKPLSLPFMQKLLSTFDHVVFSTRFQEQIYEDAYGTLPAHSVIENALPSGNPQKHQKHEPFRVLFMGRFVGFKNLRSLIRAVEEVQNASLTFVGDGPVKSDLLRFVKEREMELRVVFLAPVHGEKKQEILAMYDLLVIPSITEISPNVALEARAAGLPVLLTQETGLSSTLAAGMVVRDLVAPEHIGAAIQDIRNHYDVYATEAAAPAPTRSYKEIAQEFLALIQ